MLSACHCYINSMDSSRARGARGGPIIYSAPGPIISLLRHWTLCQIFGRGPMSTQLAIKIGDDLFLLIASFSCKQLAIKNR